MGDEHFLLENAAATRFPNLWAKLKAETTERNGRMTSDEFTLFARATFKDECVDWRVLFGRRHQTQGEVRLLLQHRVSTSAKAPVRGSAPTEDDPKVWQWDTSMGDVDGEEVPYDPWRALGDGRPTAMILFDVALIALKDVTVKEIPSSAPIEWPASKVLRIDFLRPPGGYEGADPFSVRLWLNDASKSERDRFELRVEHRIDEVVDRIVTAENWVPVPTSTSGERCWIPGRRTYEDRENERTTVLTTLDFRTDEIPSEWLTPHGMRHAPW